MCFIANKDFDKAQRYLKLAYDNAQNKENYYDTYKIDNQQARLYLKQASQHSTNIKEALEYFFKADNLLSKRDDNHIYKYKVMLKYQEFINNRGNSFDSKTKDKIISICKARLSDMQRSRGFDDYFKQEQIYQKCKNTLNMIVATLSTN